MQNKTKYKSCTSTNVMREIEGQSSLDLASEKLITPENSFRELTHIQLSLTLPSYATLAQYFEMRLSTAHVGWQLASMACKPFENAYPSAN
jgi:hypothetical protein